MTGHTGFKGAWLGLWLQSPGAEVRGGAFREGDPLGGADPYSASTAGQERVAGAFRMLGLALATVRAGIVIGGGDWAPDRIVADCVRAALAGAPIEVRAPGAVRPRQHVLCPLGRWDLAQGLDATVSWYAGYRDGADMRAEKLRQIAAFERGEA